MLVGIIKLNTFTRQYSLTAMATKELQRKPDMRVSGSSLGAKTIDKKETKQSPPASAAGGSLDENSAVDQMMSINRRLVAQIETLRLKVDVDARQHEKTRTGLVNTTDSKIKARELEVVNLKSELKKKESKLSTLETENEKKSSEIQRMQEYIQELKDDVRASKSFADEMQAELDQLRKDRKSLQSGSAYKQKEEEIQKLQQEVDTLKLHLQTLEKELLKAKEKIAHQGGKLRVMEADKGTLQVKYKEELAKVTQTMRHEIERMRDVMKQQWEEMRELREQNEDMRSDIREIRELLSEQVSEPTNQGRIYGHVHSPFNLQPLTPSLPSLSKDTRRIIPGRKKKP